MAGAALDLTTSVGFGAMDIFQSAISLAMNFKEFLLLGIAFVVAPWIYGVIVAAIKRARSKQTA